MNILIQENQCWVCGCFTNLHNTENPLTDHHTLPKHLRPKKNVIVPVCKRCHNRLNQYDIKGIFAFAYKIDRTAEQVKEMTKSLYDKVKNSIGRGRKNG